MKIRIPKKAKKVFSGVIFDVHHWKQKMFDGTYETFEMLERRPTVDIIAVAGDKIIVLQQKQPGRALYPSLPGGGIDKKETPREAAARELLEETGYTAEKFKLFGEYFGNSKMYFHEYQYIARGCKKIAKQKLDSGEKIKAILVGFDTFLQLCRNPLFAVPVYLKFQMYEALLDPKKKEALRKRIFGL
ncbi:MAG: ADP-ribose pyrophosphatase [Parcubacteria group bacterium Gr01-1014_33]|nr:MAG: ADP-ribose pyrophosphatase [Parcubacteria group bacterium Gr01-1014_33]